MASRGHDVGGIDRGELRASLRAKAAAHVALASLDRLALLIEIAGVDLGGPAVIL